MCSPTTASSRCRVASGIPIARARWSRPSATRRRALKGLRFETLEEAQAYLDRWDARWADTRIHGTTKRQVAAMFAEERPACGRCPSSRFATTSSARARCISTIASRSTPPTTARRPAGSARQSPCSGTPATSASSIRAPGHSCASTAVTPRGRHAIHPDDRPTRTPPSTLTLLAQAARAGAHIGPLCAAIHRRQGEAGVRRILGVLSLVKKYGAAVVDAACAAALELDVADYRFVRRYLERHPPPRSRSARSIR